MREIVFDIETTGLDFRQERIIEIGAVELINGFQSGRVFQEYINPDGREIHPDAFSVHGIKTSDLLGKPFFTEIAEKFLEFIDNAKLVAHNATFDVSFLNAELQRSGYKPLGPERVVDTLILAKRRHPMGPNSLDALCKRYGVDKKDRILHGALLDSKLLAQIYIELLGGKQGNMILDNIKNQNTQPEIRKLSKKPVERKIPLASRITKEDHIAHQKMIKSLGELEIWSKIKVKIN